VIYDGSNDGSRVPPAWQLWLRGTIDELPEKALPPVRKFQKEPTGNLTGTMEAFRPDGALGSGRLRPASTGDYEPWIPE
jgi:NADH:ubiquinone oxidoreductase subunit